MTHRKAIDAIYGPTFFKKHSTDADPHKHARTLIPMNTRTQPYLYEHLRETEPANSRDRRSHHRRFAVDGDVAYH